MNNIDLKLSKTEVCVCGTGRKYHVAVTVNIFIYIILSVVYFVEI